MASPKPILRGLDWRRFYGFVFGFWVSRNRTASLLTLFSLCGMKPITDPQENELKFWNAKFCCLFPGVSCDSCLKGNFRGRRYKCLICYDYDLCATCYEAGATTTRHTTDHPMQCILTRTDFGRWCHVAIPENREMKKMKSSFFPPVKDKHCGQVLTFL